MSKEAGRMKLTRYHSDALGAVTVPEREEDDLDQLRAEVRELYLRRINHGLTDEEAADYQEKDRMLVALERARRGGVR